MASFAGHSGSQVRVMAPIDLGTQAIDPHPGDGLFALSEIAERLNRWFIFRYGDVAGQAFRSRGQAHVLFRIGVRVAKVTLQPLRDMELVAKWNRLRRRIRIAGLRLSEQGGPNSTDQRNSTYRDGERQVSPLRTNSSSTARFASSHA